MIYRAGEGKFHKILSQYFTPKHVVRVRLKDLTKMYEHFVGVLHFLA